MRIMYFSKNYTPHDYRFLSSLSKTEHAIYYLRLEANSRQTEDRPVPANIQQILWAGGRGEFRWQDLPRLAFDLRRVLRGIQPDLIHAGPIQSCAFLAALSGFRPVLAMSWGYDLVMEADKSTWLRWVTRYTLKRSAFFASDANVTREKAIAYGMDPLRTAIFPWGTDIEHFVPKKPARRASSSLTLFCNRTWESIYGVDVLAKAFVKVAAENPNVNLILLGGGSQGAHLRQIFMSDGVLDRVHFGGQVGQRTDDGIDVLLSILPPDVQDEAAGRKARRDRLDRPSVVNRPKDGSIDPVRQPAPLAKAQFLVQLDRAVVVATHAEDEQLSLPYWHYDNLKKPENRFFPRAFGIEHLVKRVV